MIKHQLSQKLSYFKPVPVTVLPTTQHSTADKQAAIRILLSLRAATYGY